VAIVQMLSVVIPARMVTFSPATEHANAIVQDLAMVAQNVMQRSV